MIALVLAGPYAYVAHVGNCRAYLARRGVLEALTSDHTLGMRKVQRGELTADAYETHAGKNLLTRCLGGGAEVAADVAEVRVLPGDYFLLVSDGLTASRTQEEIAAALDQPDPELASSQLTPDTPGTSDATAVVVKVGAEAGREPEHDGEFLSSLRRIFLFETLSDSELRLIAPYLEERMFQEGDVVCEEGAPGDSFFVVASGSVAVSRAGEKLVDIGQGSHVGELALVLDRNRTATVTANGPTRLFELTRASFNTIAEHRPDLGVHLSMGCLKVVSERLSAMTDRWELREFEEPDED